MQCYLPTFNFVLPSHLEEIFTTKHLQRYSLYNFCIFLQAISMSTCVFLSVGMFNRSLSCCCYKMLLDIHFSHSQYHYHKSYQVLSWANLTLESPQILLNHVWNLSRSCCSALQKSNFALSSSSFERCLIGLVLSLALIILSQVYKMTLYQGASVLLRIVATLS